MRRVWTLAAFVGVAGCAANPRPAALNLSAPVDERTIVHLLNRTSFGPRPGDVVRVQSMGVRAYLEQQLHPDTIGDDALQSALAPLTALSMSPIVFATDYYAPMATARQEFTNTQKPPASGIRLPHLRGHLLPIAAVSLPGSEKPVVVLQQAPVTSEELRFQRENQQVFEALQAQKLLRAVYSERQLQEVLTDFWFNHFNVDATKIEDRPVMVAYERDVIRPHVLGKFRDLLEATAKSPAMLFYLDNWLSAGRRLNENYGRELLELHTLGVDGGYTQHDVIDVARCFTGWTMANPHDGLGFLYDDRKHDRGEKRVLGHRIKAGHGIEDGEQVLDIVARHPATARFIATKLARRFVADNPPPALVDRVARRFRQTDGDLREVMRAIFTSPEFVAAPAFDAKVKSPFEFVASALRATRATITNPRAFVATIASMGEPLYQCQPPTGYAERAAAWVNTGALVSRLNFALAFAANGLNAAIVEARSVDAPDQLSATTRTAVDGAKTPALRVGVWLGSPDFQRR